MTGEKDDFREPRQPGGRPPAPGPLALVQAFVNTHFSLGADHGAEVLGSPSALADWLRRGGLLPGPAPVLEEGDLARALGVREQLRTLAGAGPAASAPGLDALARLDAAAAGTRVEVRFTAAGPRFTAAPEAGIDGAIGALLAIAAQAISDGTWSRLKVCPGEHCGWAFYDHSRNRSGRWCSMSVCGGRAKAREHYRRRVALEP